MKEPCLLDFLPPGESVDERNANYRIRLRAIKELRRLAKDVFVGKVTWEEFGRARQLLHRTCFAVEIASMTEDDLKYRPDLRGELDHEKEWLKLADKLTELVRNVMEASKEMDALMEKI
jgi:hypothetical protein